MHDSRPGLDRAHALVALSVLVGLLSIVFILDYTGYPYEPFRFRLFSYFLRTQDLSGSWLLLGIVFCAALPVARRPALAFVEALGRRPWAVACATFLVLCLGALLVQHDHPLAQDEYLALFQSRVFAAGRLTGQFPPDLLDHLIPFWYRDRFVVASAATGAVASNYWPGFSAILAPFSLIGAPWACNPLLASLSLVLMARLAAQLTGALEAGGWAMLLALASPQFTATAITYYSMSAHLLLNLVFAWLLLDLNPRRLVGAGFVGSVALVLHQPVPHVLFALPWLIWVARQPGARANLLWLAAGYAPLVALAGFGWALFLGSLQKASLWMAPYPDDGEFLHRVGNFAWLWQMKLGWAFGLPSPGLLWLRLGEWVRLWAWAVPGLPVLAAAGWWMARRRTPLLLLGVSFLSTALGFLFVAYEQGHGWGARYFHSAWSALPVLGASALVLGRESAATASLRGTVAVAALLSLVLAGGLRGWQIHDYVGMTLERRPPVEPDVRQIAFIPADYQTYSADLVQNDPFLRDPVIYLLSRGKETDARLVRERFPGARQTVDEPRGQVWRIE